MNIDSVDEILSKVNGYKGRNGRFAFFSVTEPEENGEPQIDIVDLMTPAMKLFAMDYARRGFEVFPCVPGENRPYTRNGVNDASSDPAIVAAWWDRWPDAVIGWRIPVGYVAVDVDQHADKETGEVIDGWATLREAGIEMPDTPFAARSGGGGDHLLYLVPPREMAKTAAPINGLAGVDTRAHAGGYIIIAPSIHKSGNRYAWADTVDQSADLWTLLGGCPAAPLGVLYALHDKPRRTYKPSGELTEEMKAAWRDALKHVDADDRENWTVVARGLKLDYGDEAFELFDEYSARSKKYRGPDDCRKTWDSFNRADGTTFRHILKLARDGGWRGELPDAFTRERKARVAAAGVDPEDTSIDLSDEGARDALLYAVEYDDGPGMPMELRYLDALNRLARAAPALYESLIGALKKLGVRITKLETALKKRAAELAKAVAAAGGELWPELDRNMFGGIVASEKNMRTCLAHLGKVLRFDEFAGRETIENVGDDAGPRLLTDVDMSRINSGLEQHCGWTLNIGTAKELMIQIARMSPFHPVREWLDAAEASWDGHPRLDTWLTEYLGVDDTPLHRAFGAKTLIAVVRRIRKPGTDFHQMLILEGAQRAGKSAVVRALAIRPNWLNENFDFGASGRDMIEQTRGFTVLEIPELDKLSKAEADTVKRVLSQRQDNGRAAYARLPETVERTAVMIGTTNKPHYLKDETGAMRFWPIRVNGFPSGVKDEEGNEIRRVRLPELQRDVMQLYAEAATRETAGEALELPLGLWNAAQAAQGERYDASDIEQLMEVMLDGVTGAVRTENLWQALGLDLDKRGRHQAGFRKALARLGWEIKNTRAFGRQMKAYVKGDHVPVSLDTLRLNLARAWTETADDD